MEEIIMYSDFLVILYFSQSLQLLVSNPLLFLPPLPVVYINMILISSEIFAQEHLSIACCIRSKPACQGLNVRTRM